MANGLYGGATPQAYVDSLFAPQAALLQQQQAQRNAGLQSLVQAILSHLQTPEQASAPTNAAIAAQTAQANAAANTLKAANPNDQTIANLRAIGAPGAQQSQVTNLNNTVFNGNAGLLQGVGGAMPAGLFAADQAARNSYLSALPALVGSQAILGSNQLGSLASKENLDFANQKVQALQKAQSDLASYQEQQQKLRLDAQNQAFNQWATGQRLKQSAANASSLNAYRGATLKQRQQSLNLEARKFAQQTVNQNRNYSLALQRLGISKRSLALRIASQQSKLDNGGFSQKDISKYTAQANGIALAAKGQNLGYDKAYAQILQKGIPASIAEGALAHNGLEQMPNSIAPISKALQDAYNTTVGMNAGTVTKIGVSPSGVPIFAGIPKNLPKSVASKVTAVVDQAVKYLGTPYAWGGESPTGFDCSGLAQFIYKNVGVNIPRTTYDQFKTGLSVPRSQLQAGDLVFFKGSDSKNGLPGHVGIYIGSGRLIEAPYTGSAVSVSTLSSHNDYMGARRYVG